MCVGGTAWRWLVSSATPGPASSSVPGSSSNRLVGLRECCGSKCTLNLNPDPGFWPNLDPDLVLCYNLILKKCLIKAS